MGYYRDLSKRKIKLIDFLPTLSTKYEYDFIYNYKMLREVKEVNGIRMPIRPDKESFVENGYEEILSKHVSGIRHFPESKLCNVFIE